MRSLAFIAMLGSFVACSSLVGQSLTEHAAAAAGATIGTAAGKPLGTSLGKIFGDVDKTASAAATPKTAKPVVDKSAPAKRAPVAPPPETTALAPAAALPSKGSGDGAAGTGSDGSSHRSARRREVPVQSEAGVPTPIVPVAAEPVVKEPTAEEVARIQVGATTSELRAALGAPESMVSIPGDDGHLLEICQYWANGAPVGTIRLDNGRVVSVKTSN